MAALVLIGMIVLLFTVIGIRLLLGHEVEWWTDYDGERWWK